MSPSYDPTESPVPAEALCDFCAATEPIVLFPQKHGFTMLMPDGTRHRFEDPWTACATCAPLVENRQLHLLLDRAMKKHPAYWDANRQQRRFIRATLKKMYQAMYDSIVGRPEPLPAPPPRPFHELPPKESPQPSADD
ncbi:hypothetical protein [Actinomadura atramentaria]|uniref:hypothetical protein n=1 Tax=Actinomadura atramentaria TaxID=1990 RepID=UPI00036BA5B2|nr:hypothetical protein [Actinomadura atramentaria]